MRNACKNRNALVSATHRSVCGSAVSVHIFCNSDISWSSTCWHNFHLLYVVEWELASLCHELLHVTVLLSLKSLMTQVHYNAWNNCCSTASYCRTTMLSWVASYCRQLLSPVIVSVQQVSVASGWQCWDIHQMCLKVSHLVCWSTMWMWCEHGH